MKKIVMLLKDHLNRVISERTIILIALLLAVSASSYSLYHGYAISYGDAESHLNISKRVIDSPTPGFSQLGGIWLPLPHILMIPFVFFDPLWRSGAAGAIVSGICFIISCFTLYKMVLLITSNRLSSFVAFLVFALNPNILYMQTTSMTEIPLLTFFILSVYFFVVFLKNTENFVALICAAFFGFAASLSRYDGWILVALQASILGFYLLVKRHARMDWIGRLTLFATLAFFGIFLWFLWDFLILGDAFYFSNSPFSAKSQQQGWLGRGELPSYHNLSSSIHYYSITAATNIGYLISVFSLLGLILFLFVYRRAARWTLPILLGFPFLFYTLTLYIGQSVIFIPQLTPEWFEWQLFNVRYGLMMVPFAAFFIGFLYYKTPVLLKPVIILIVFIQGFLFLTGYEKVLTWEDGVHGLSSSKTSNAQIWIANNYTDGYVLIDDFARTLSIIRSPIPMSNIIYIGNKPYWEQSLKNPERYTKWIVMQRDDAVWKALYEPQEKRGHLYKYFRRTYTSPQILVFERIDDRQQISIK